MTVKVNLNVFFVLTTPHKLTLQPHLFINSNIILQMGVDFTNTSLPRAFRNIKEILKQHITDSSAHKKAQTWARKEEKERESQRRVSSTAGYTLGRIAYAIIYRGRPYSDFTMDVLLASKMAL